MVILLLDRYAMAVMNHHVCPVENWYVIFFYSIKVMHFIMLKSLIAPVRVCSQTSKE